MKIQLLSIIGALIILWGFIMLQLGRWGPKDSKYLQSVYWGSLLMLIAAGIMGNYGFMLINGVFMLVVLYQALKEIRK
jgi:hypothetical protein